MTDGRIHGEVRIVGAGLLGTSLGLVLTRNGVDVSLVDVSPGVSVGPSAQLRQRARIRADVVLPQPRGPLNR